MFWVVLQTITDDLLYDVSGLIIFDIQYPSVMFCICLSLLKSVLSKFLVRHLLP